MRPSLRDFDMQNKIRQAQVFIRARQFDDAEELLASLGTPDANRLLLRLHKYRLSLELNKPTPQAIAQNNIKEPQLASPKQYKQVRILSYGVRFIALLWLLVGIITFTSPAPEPVLIPYTQNQESAVIIFAQAFFIYTAGAVIDMLADMATNQALLVTMLSED
jgi:hypothetical protein